MPDRYHELRDLARRLGVDAVALVPSAARPPRRPVRSCVTAPAAPVGEGEPRPRAPARRRSPAPLPRELRVVG